MSESNYEKLFGTPERAARTLSAMCAEIESCDHCEMKRTIGGCGSYDALLEWLRGDVE